MARFHGKVGYGNTVEAPKGSGVWVDEIVEHEYFGDVLRHSRRLDDPQARFNPDIVVVNSISIVADQYANQNYINIKYVEWDGVRWTVSSVEVRRPRLILYLGSPYNGPTPDTRARPKA